MIECWSRAERSKADFVAPGPSSIVSLSLRKEAWAARTSPLEASKLTKGLLMYPRIVASLISSAFCSYGIPPTPRKVCCAGCRGTELTKYREVAEGAYVTVWEETKYCPAPSTSASNGRRCKRPSGTIMSRSFFERSEEHTSELQSRLHLVCRLLLEKKKNNTSIPSRFFRQALFRTIAVSSSNN